MSVSERLVMFFGVCFHPVINIPRSPAGTAVHIYPPSPSTAPTPSGPPLSPPHLPSRPPHPQPPKALGLAPTLSPRVPRPPQIGSHDPIGPSLCKDKRPAHNPQGPVAPPRPVPPRSPGAARNRPRHSGGASRAAHSGTRISFPPPCGVAALPRASSSTGLRGQRCSSRGEEQTSPIRRLGSHCIHCLAKVRVWHRGSKLFDYNAIHRGKLKDGTLTVVYETRYKRYKEPPTLPPPIGFILTLFNVGGGSTGGGGLRGSDNSSSSDSNSSSDSSGTRSHPRTSPPPRSTRVLSSACRSGFPLRTGCDALSVRPPTHFPFLPSFCL